MDVIDDAVTVLRVILDYFGIDADDVSEYVQRLNVRRRDAIQHLGHGAVIRWDRLFVQRCLRLSDRWHSWRGQIRNKSLVRIAGTKLPLKSPKRLKIQKYLLRPQRRRHDSCDSDSSLTSLTSVCTTGTTEDDLVWVEEDLGNNCVRMRAQKKNKDESDTDTEASEDMEELLPLEPIDVPLMNSTMISSASMLSTNDPMAMDKINALEDELTSLRSQIAMLVLNQEQNKSQITLPMDTSVSNVPAPPPPAPPAPPCPMALSTPPLLKTTESTCVTSIPVKPMLTDAFASKIQEPIKGLCERPSNKPNSVLMPPSMSEVLKGLGSVKLRSVQRSPGGTPLKKPPASGSNTADPASLIAIALKKKFAHQKFQSPELDKENDSQNFSSPEDSSPNIQRPVRAKRRSLLFDERRKSVGLPRV